MRKKISSHTSILTFCLHLCQEWWLEWSYTCANGDFQGLPDICRKSSIENSGIKINGGKKGKLQETTQEQVKILKNRTHPKDMKEDTELIKTNQKRGTYK